MGCVMGQGRGRWATQNGLKDKSSGPSSFGQGGARQPDGLPVRVEGETRLHIRRLNLTGVDPDV